MGWGVLESRRATLPRGTAIVGAKEITDDNVSDYGTSKKIKAVALSPEPSDDPNDPLNW